MDESGKQPFQPSRDDDQVEWITSTFRHSATLGDWALPDIFEDSVTVRAFQPGGTFDQGSGSTDPAVSVALVQVLRNFTVTPLDCLFAIWVGYAGLPKLEDALRLEVPPQREMVLLRGPIDSATRSFESPESDRRPLRWWPSSREWAVGADIYSETLTVGGSAACVAAVRSAAGLDTVEL